MSLGSAPLSRAMDNTSSNIGKGAMYYPDLTLCYERHIYRLYRSNASGPPIPQLENYYEDASPEKLEEIQRISNFAKKINHPSINKAKFFKMEGINRHLQRKPMYSTFTSLEDSVFAQPNSPEGTTGKVTDALNYSVTAKAGPLQLQNNVIHMPYRPVYKATVQQVLGDNGARVAAGARQGTDLAKLNPKYPLLTTLQIPHYTAVKSSSPSRMTRKASEPFDL